MRRNEMTDNQAAQIVEALEKIEKHLQAIDWKFWDMHQKFSKDDTTSSDKEKPVAPATEVDNDLESLAEIVNEPVKPAKPIVNHTLKYPSIEIIK
jgi:hypothetical protein